MLEEKKKKERKRNEYLYAKQILLCSVSSFKVCLLVTERETRTRSQLKNEIMNLLVIQCSTLSLTTFRHEFLAPLTTVIFVSLILLKYINRIRKEETLHTSTDSPSSSPLPISVFFHVISNCLFLLAVNVYMHLHIHIYLYIIFSFFASCPSFFCIFFLANLPLHHPLGPAIAVVLPLSSL